MIVFEINKDKHATSQLFLPANSVPIKGEFMTDHFSQSSNPAT